jgi:hypothetical protein
MIVDCVEGSVVSSRLGYCQACDCGRRVAPRYLTIVECRPPWREDMGTEWTRFPIARLRYSKGSRCWALCWRDRNLRFRVYDRVAPSAGVEELLQEIGRDPTAIFWG